MAAKKSSAALAAVSDSPAPEIASDPLPSAPQGQPIFNTPVEIALDTIVPGLNPRKTFDEASLAELANSFKTKGQLQPIKVRPKGSKNEVVFGERRVRAARLAGWQTITGYVVELNDAEALEEALLENGARDDVDEYEEAEAFRRLHVEHGRSVEEIASRVGKSIGTVYARLKLAELDGKARAMAQEKGVPASTALLAARIVGAERQREAVKQIADREMSYREAADHIQQNYMLELGKAPFDITDEKLVPAAGSCSKCPKRTGNQPELFADVKSKDICTDAKCFKSKEDAVWKLKVAKAKEDGQKVLPESEAKKVFSNYGDSLNYNAEYVDVDKGDHYGNSPGLLRKAIEKKKDGAPATILARAPSGKIVELIPKDVAAKLQRETKKREPSAEDKRWKEQRKRELEKRKAEEAVDQEVDRRIVAAAEKKEFSDAVWRFLADRLLSHYGSKEIAQRRGLNPYDDKGFPAAIKKLTAAEARGAVVECVVHVVGCDPEESAEAFGIDRKKVAEELKKAADAPKKTGVSYRPEEQCAVPGCGKPKDRSGFCVDHGVKLSPVEQKSILERNKRLAAEGKLPVTRLPPKSKPAATKKPTKKKKG